MPATVLEVLPEAYVSVLEVLPEAYVSVLEVLPEAYVFFCFPFKITGHSTFASVSADGLFREERNDLN